MFRTIHAYAPGLLHDPPFPPRASRELPHQVPQVLWTLTYVLENTPFNYFCFRFNLVFNFGPSS